MRQLGTLSSRDGLKVLMSKRMTGIVEESKETLCTPKTPGEEETYMPLYFKKTI